MEKVSSVETSSVGASSRKASSHDRGGLDGERLLPRGAVRVEQPRGQQRQAGRLPWGEDVADGGGEGLVHGTVGSGSGADAGSSSSGLRSATATRSNPEYERAVVLAVMKFC